MGIFDNCYQKSITLWSCLKCHRKPLQCFSTFWRSYAALAFIIFSFIIFVCLGSFYPENLFLLSFSQSPVVSVGFARFHPNLLVGGTYSGQIVLWDNRSHRRTPVQRTPLSAAAHTVRPPHYRKSSLLDYITHFQFQ